MKETEEKIESILLGGESINLLNDAKPEDILSSLSAFCRNRDFFESKDVVQIFRLVNDKIVNEAALLREQDIDKMIDYINNLSFLFREKNPAIEYGIVQLETITILVMLRQKKGN